MNGRRPIALAVTALAFSAAACASDPPVAEQSDLSGNTSAALDTAIRDQVTRAAVFAHRCSGLEGGALDDCAAEVKRGVSTDAAWASWQDAVRSWSKQLDHSAICRALDAHRGHTSVTWAAGVDLGGVDREIAVDLTRREAAVFTYGTNGVRNVLDPRSKAYQAVAYANDDRALLDGWQLTPQGADTLPTGIDLATARGWKAADGARTGAVAPLAAGAASAIRDFATVDGATYGNAPRVSTAATHALAKATSFLGQSTAGEVIHLAPTTAAGLGAGGTTAAFVLRWAGPQNGAALHAAILAVANAEIEGKQGSDRDAYCGAATVGTETLSFRAIGLAPRAGGGAPLPLADFPEPPKTITTTGPTPDCSTDDELRCDVLYPGQKKVCSVNGAQHCCINEMPVTQICQTDDDCRRTGSTTAQCAQVQNAAADGRSFTCQEPAPNRCAAIQNPRPVDDDGLDRCDDSGAWPRIWEGELCGKRGAKWRARCFVKNSECQSSARSCLEGASGDRWDKDYAACGDASGRYMEAAGSGIYVTGVCCNK